MMPQFTYDNKGNAVGVFLPIEEWNQLKKTIRNLRNCPSGKRTFLIKG